MLEKENIDRVQPFRCINKQLIPPSMESSTFAIQDQLIHGKLPNKYLQIEQTFSPTRDSKRLQQADSQGKASSTTVA